MYMMRNIYDANKDSESAEKPATGHQWKAVATLDKGAAWAPHWNVTQYQVLLEVFVLADCIDVVTSYVSLLL